MPARMPAYDYHKVIAQVTGILTLAAYAVYQRLSTGNLQNHRPPAGMPLQKAAPFTCGHRLMIGQHLERIAGGGDIFGKMRQGRRAVGGTATGGTQTAVHFEGGVVALVGPALG